MKKVTIIYTIYEENGKDALHEDDVGANILEEVAEFTMLMILKIKRMKRY